MKSDTGSLESKTRNVKKSKKSERSCEVLKSEQDVTKAKKIRYFTSSSREKWDIHYNSETDDSSSYTIDGDRE